MRLLPVLLLVCSIAALTVVSASAAAPRTAAGHSCSEGDRFLQQLHVAGATCAKARKVMYGWAKSSSCIRGGDGLLASRVRTCTVLRFRCVPRKAEGGVTVRCTRGGAAVRFFDSQG